MTHPTSQGGSTHGFRQDIQGLRAVAVLLVVAYHLYPNRVTGGYVGVDVFFVISGYLITAHLVREAGASGTVSLRRFWARRIRRLLPASLLVLLVSTILMVIWLPETLWGQTIRQIGASALYVQNWALASDSVDYLALGNTPTLVQHYWSLSVEEQFYLFWPVLVLGGIAGIAGAGRHRADLARAVRRRLVPLVLVVIAASLTYSIHLTATDPGPAYFVTPTRIWELGVGALLAVVAVPTLPALLDRLLAWSGVTAIVAAGLLYDGSTAFPGYTALLPVLGAAALIASRPDGSWWSPQRWLALRPAVFIGDISYAVYLWHWPLTVITPYITTLDLRTRDKAAILLITIVLSWLSTRLVEDPVRNATVLTGAPLRSYVAGAVGMGVVLAGVAAADWEGERRADRLAATPPVAGCLGPAALDPRNECSSVAGDGTFIVPPAKVAEQNAEPSHPGCQAGITSTTLAPCTLGRAVNPERTVALVGDSHATHWFGAFDALADGRGWKVQTYAQASCPLSESVRTLPSEVTDEAQRACNGNNEEVLDLLVADDRIDTVFVTSYSSVYGWESPDGEPMRNPETEGFQRAWERLTKAGKQVVAIRAVPLVKDQVNAPNCIVTNLDALDNCALAREEALPEDPAATAAEEAGEGVHLVDLTEQFCDERRCHAVIGQVIVYRDYSHLSLEYSRMLAPYLERAFDALDES